MDTADVLAHGQAFHRQLFAAIGALHPEDSAHDLAVGAAVVLAVDGGNPAAAVAGYNDWAHDHGYAPIAWVGSFLTPDGRLSHWVDIQDAVISVDRDYRVTVLKETVCR